jgi:hypothetical protein
LTVAKVFLVLGVACLLIAGMFATGIKLGQLPGDLHWHGDGWSVHLPLTSCLLVSAVASLIWNLFRN